MKIKEGQMAPEFTLPDQDGVVHALKEYRGKWVLLYFYPKDDTPGCTKEACAIRDDFPAFAQSEMQVLGVSADSVKSHKKFAQMYSLPFTLLADTEKEVVDAYGVWGIKKFMDREYEGVLRHSFLIDPRGMITKVYEEVTPEEHAQEVLRDLETLKG